MAHSACCPPDWKYPRIFELKSLGTHRSKCSSGKKREKSNNLVLCGWRIIIIITKPSSTQSRVSLTRSLDSFTSIRLESSSTTAVCKIEVQPQDGAKRTFRCKSGRGQPTAGKDPRACKVLEIPQESQGQGVKGK